MQPLFSETGMRRLSEIVRDGVLCAFDFDGTLAPIMARPEAVRLPGAIRDLLVDLSGHAPVAIITGRALADIETRLGFDPDFLVGNHGMEGVPGWETGAAGHARLCAGWNRQLQESLADSHAPEGISIEDKGYSLSVHYRAAPDSARAAAFLDDVIARLHPRPRAVAGKYVVNLVAEDALHKGAALEALISHCGATQAIYVGDDVTDEDVFRIKRPGWMSVRVEQSALSAADFFIPQPGDIRRVLEELQMRLHMCDARNWLKTGHSSLV